VGQKYFGTDGVRGRVGEAPITPDFVLRLGHAAGRVLARETAGSRPTVLIGKDTRVSGYMLEAALEAGYREVRLIHGRGKGVQRARVQKLLARDPRVERFADAPPGRGGWGATVVWLRAP